MKKLLLYGGLLFILATIAHLLFKPVPIDPVAWTPPKAPSLETGPYAANDKLAALTPVSVAEFGRTPEDLTADTLGNIYTGLRNGKIVKFDTNLKNPTVVAETGGRPLGMMFDSLGQLIIADASKGLISLNLNTKAITVLTDEYEGKKMKFVDHLDIASDGKIYFSDASSKFDFHGTEDDIVEHGGHGRLFVYNPSDQTTNLLLKDLNFANGVALGPDEVYVLVNETGAYQTMKYWLKGAKKGTSEVFASNYPGFPDNLYFDGKNTFWVAFANPRSKSLDDIHPSPFLKKVVRRLPRFLQPIPKPYDLVAAYDLKGNLVQCLQNPAGVYGPITTAQIIGDKLFIGSLEADKFGYATLVAMTND